MNKVEFITVKERAQVIAKELGDVVTLEHYDDECDRVIFNEPVNGLHLLLLLHAGIRHGSDSLARAFGVPV